MEKRNELLMNTNENYMKPRSKEYHRLHRWLIYYHPKVNKCNVCGAINKKRYEWALKKGCKHEKNIENYIEMCVKCHREYDGGILILIKNPGAHLKGKPNWRRRKTVCKNPVTDEVVGKFDSLTIAAKEFGVPHTSIYESMKAGRLYKGLKWEYES